MHCSIKREKSVMVEANTLSSSFCESEKRSTRLTLREKYCAILKVLRGIEKVYLSSALERKFEVLRPKAF